MFIELFRGKKGWKWRIKGRNGEIVAVAQKYVSRDSALRTSKRLKTVGIVTIVENERGRYRTLV
jgi:uncharacterized protein YegP (UPF0339 family)